MRDFFVFITLCAVTLFTYLLYGHLAFLRLFRTYAPSLFSCALRTMRALCA